VKIALQKKELLEKANAELATMPWFETGMELVEPRMEGGILLMFANGMFDAKGDVRPELAEHFNDFAKSFSERYTLA
jgi:hypothetical protein